MSIKQDVVELKQLQAEISRLNKEVKRLRLQKENCENRITDWLDSNDQPGVRHNGITIIQQDRRKRAYIKKGEKLERGLDVLERYGIPRDRDTLEELLEAMRGPAEHHQGLKLL